MTQETSPLKAAICEFKKKGITIKKESKNPFFKSSYADLATVLDAIEIEAANCGLVITSGLSHASGVMVLTTTLEHKDSEEKKDSSFPVTGSKPQEIGSGVTYARRYNIQCLLNLAAEDDDGNAASNVKVTAKAKKERWVEIMKELDNVKSLDDLGFLWTSLKEELAMIKFEQEESYIKLQDRKDELKKLFNDQTIGE